MLYRVAVWMHLVAASVFIGGILFFVLVLVPVVRRARGPQTTELVRAIGTRFRAVGYWSLALLAATGVVNLVSRYPAEDLLRERFWLSPFGQALGVKLVLVLAVVGVSLAHDGVGVRATEAALSDPEAEATLRLRALASWLGRLDALLVLAILYMAVVLVRGFP